MIEKYKKIPDLPTGSPMDDDLIPFVKLSTNQTMKAPKAALMGAQAIAVAFVDNDMVFTLTNGVKISIPNAKLQLRGEAGDEVQLRKTSTHLQWKLVDSEEWTDIVSLAEITGPKGDVGAKIVGASFNGNDLVFILDDASTVTIPDGRLAIKGETGAKVTSVAFSGNDIVFTLNDTTTVTLTGAKLALKGDVGSKITGAAFSGNDIVFTLDDTSTATLVGGKTILTGPKGDTGRGVTSIEKTGTVDLIDTYTITYSDNTTSTFTVTNGLDGTDGIDGDDAYVYIAYASDANGTGFTTVFDANLDYVAIKNTTIPIASPVASDFTGLWKKYKGETGETGEPGPTGTSFIWAQTYDPGVTYPVNRVVAYNGSSYICIQESTRNLPTNTAFWNLVAQKGLDGKGSGDMLASVYDPTNINGSAFDMDNMAEGDTNKLVSSSEKSEWSGKQDALGFTPENVANKGEASGYAELDESGKVPSSQLPSYVDDVLEYANAAALPVTGEAGKIYITLDDNKTFRWSGSAYVEISASLALGETPSTAYRGDRGKTAYDHAGVTSGNPHGVSKADVGLENVDNTSDDNKPVSTAQQAALDEKQDTLVSRTNIKTINSEDLLGSGNIEILSGGGGLNNATLTYNGDGSVDTITDNDTSITYTMSYLGGKLVSITDGINTWTLNYTNGLLTSLIKT